MQCIFTIDVEDWYHILDLPSTPPLTKWAEMPSRIETNFERLLDILDENHAKATCFFLGWIAERFPHLVKMAVERGHEIASHGYAHELVYRMSETEFLEDALKTRKLLADRCGRQINGFRASGFSATESTPWFFDRLIEAGYKYDSSVFPAVRSHGGMPDSNHFPHLVTRASGKIFEFPISVSTLFGKKVCLFGGGYLRLFPYPVVRYAGRKVLSENRPVIFYAHPREIDPDQPRLPMSLIRKFKTYVNLRGLESKIRRLTRDFELTSFEQYMLTHPIPAGDSK